MAMDQSGVTGGAKGKVDVSNNIDSGLITLLVTLKYVKKIYKDGKEFIAKVDKGKVVASGVSPSGF